MLKISKLMRNHINTQISSAFGVVTKDHQHHGKEVKLLLFSIHSSKNIQ